MYGYNFIKYKKYADNIKKYADHMKEDITICIDGERITLKISQTQDYQEIHKKTNISISIYNDKIICNTSVTVNEQHKIF